MIAGFGLHTGARARVWFHREPGPVRLRASGVEAPIEALEVDGASRSSAVTGCGGRLNVATVEHLFAALEARAIRRDLVIEVEGPEIPLLDGGASAWCEALDPTLLPAPRPIIVAPATFVEGASEYVFEPGASVRVEVTVDFDDARIAPAASWDGDAVDFCRRIAPARTFGFAREVGDLLARGLARHVEPGSVVLFADGEVLSAGMPYTADEPARHKLLDLLGDLYLHGGAPIGALRARRPGHAATHAVMRRALDAGVVRAMIDA